MDKGRPQTQAEYAICLRAFHLAREAVSHLFYAGGNADPFTEHIASKVPESIDTVRKTCREFSRAAKRYNLLVTESGHPGVLLAFSNAPTRYVTLPTCSVVADIAM